jgi:hypothetical protein
MGLGHPGTIHHALLGLGLGPDPGSASQTLISIILTKNIARLTLSLAGDFFICPLQTEGTHGGWHPLFAMIKV